MADDADLLEALGIGRAYCRGSMGGMIAQLVAAGHPDKTLSLTSIFSTTGNPSLPQAEKHIGALTALLPEGEEERIEHGLRILSAIGSPATPIPTFSANAPAPLCAVRPIPPAAPAGSHHR